MNGSLGGSILEGSQLYLGGWDVTSQVEERQSKQRFNKWL